MKIEISRTVMDAIRVHAATDSPREACGLLFGNEDRVDAALPTPNVAAEPQRHFEIDPAALFRAIRAERSGGPRLAGYYHSHPSGPAEPSDIDRAMAAPDGRIWIIVAGSKISAWRSIQRGFASLELRVTP